MSISRFFLVLLFSFFLFPSISKANTEPLPPAVPETSDKAAVDPLYADSRKITVETAPLAGGAKALPAETKLDPVPKPVQAELKSSQPAQKPAQAEAKPAVEIQPDTSQAKAATGAVTSAKDSEKAFKIIDWPSEFLKAGDTEVLDCNEEANPAAVPAPVAVLSIQDPDVMKLNTETADMNHIEKSVRYFSVSVKKHFNSWLERSGKYVGLMKSILRENYLPEDLVFLALIESGFNPKAYSPARASGPWQFIRGTATRYGLKVDRWVDERRDPIKSTKAAALYLKDLYSMFGNWPLAMASYNSGEGNVSRAVNRNNTLDFWELRKTRSLPRETKEYVPKFMAAKMIANNPESYGFKDLQYDQPFEFDEVPVNNCVDLNLVACCCNVPVDDIKDLNPELIRGCTPPNLPVYNLRVPKGSKEQFLKNYAAIPDDQKIARPTVADDIRYKVRRGDSMKSVARRYGVSVAELASANNLGTHSKLKKGRRLTIPDGGTAVASRKARRASSRTVASSKSKKKNRVASNKTYKVRNGDTIVSISKRFKVSQKSLIKANGNKAALRTGQKLVIPGEEAA